MTTMKSDHETIPELKLTPDPNRAYLTTLTFIEPVKIDLFKKVLLTTGILGTKQMKKKRWHESQRAQVKALIGAFSEMEGGIKVTYEFADNGDSGEGAYGRIYPKKGNSAGELCGELRSLFLYGQWTAFDIVNAHPCILLQVLKVHNYPVPNLESYCADREGKLLEVTLKYKVGRDDAKKLFIRLIYLGEFRTWARDNGLPDHVEPTPFIKAFAEEMHQNAEIIVKHNAEMRKALKPNQRSQQKAAKKRGPGRPPKKKQRVEEEQEEKTVQASPDQVVSYFIQEHERRVLQHIFDFLQQRGVIGLRRVEAMLRYDGIDLPLSKLHGHDIPVLLEEMSKYVRDRTGFNLKMAEKAYKVSPLKEEIDRQLNFEDMISDDCKQRLDNDQLVKLKLYDAQKYYFEKFVSIIQHTSDYAWVQYSFAKGVDEARKMTKGDLVTSWEHVDSLLEPETDSGDEPRKVKFIKRWVEDTNKRCCNEVAFIPFNEDLENGPRPGQKVFNLFRGFANPKGVKLSKHYTEYTEAFHYIGLQLCENDPWQYQYFWNCLVRQFKTPADRLELAFVFQGKTQGAGADVFFDAVGGLFGAPYYRNSDKISDFLGEHAEGVENKLLVVMNELRFKESAAYESRIKTLITAKTTTINPKCVRPYPVDLYPLPVFTSNNESAINFDNDDNERRFICWRPTREAIYNAEEKWGYQPGVDFDYLNKRLFKSKEFLSALYSDVMETNIDTFQPLVLRPFALGQEYYNASQRNASTHAKFFASLLRQDTMEYRQYMQENATPNKQPYTERKAWEIEEVVNYTVLKIKASILHEMYFRFVSETCGVNARKDALSLKAAIARHYLREIRSYKNSVDMYELNLRELWTLLVRKKWVKEAFEYFKEETEKGREQMPVDPRFSQLAALKGDTPLEERDSVNPGKKRPL